MDNASLTAVLFEMSENHGLNPLGRVLTAAAGGSYPQQRRDFLRALVAGGKSRNLFSRSDSVVPGLSREQMALAMEWMMASDVGLELIEHAREAPEDDVEPCRTVTHMLQRAMGADGVGRRMAKTLLSWCKERMPIPL